MLDAFIQCLIELARFSHDAYRTASVLLYTATSSDAPGIDVMANGLHSDDGGDMPPSAGDAYAVTRITVTNHSNQDYEYNALDFTLEDGGDHVQHQADALDTNISDSGLNFGTLEPGQSVTGYIAFEVPSTEDDFYLWWDPSPLAPRVLVRINNLNAGRHSGKKLRSVCECAILGARQLNYDRVPPWQALPDDDELQLADPILSRRMAMTCLTHSMRRWLREQSRFVMRKEGLTAHAPYNALVAYRRPGLAASGSACSWNSPIPRLDSAWL